MTITYIESLKVFNLSSLDNMDEKQIRTIYHLLAKKYHPDKGGNAEDFIKLREAYAILKEALINPTKRRTDVESSSNTGQTSYNSSTSFEDSPYKEAYEKLLKQIRDYEKIINSEVLIINRTSQNVNTQIDTYNKAHIVLKDWLDKSLAELEEKNRINGGKLLFQENI
ncbi:MAG: J domain-containing protein [Thermales bacterium]|nr:J domain-containing protein [Thermales bacterium]